MDVKRLDWKGVQDLHGKLWNEGFDPCKGCQYDRYASCHDGRIDCCRVQLQKTLDKPDEMKRPAWWEHKKTKK